MVSFIRTARLRWLCAALLPLLGVCASAYPVDYDVVVYGGTSGGVIAAVQAAKMGKKVALISPTKHLGGLSSSGLGWTDLGETAILGGLSREFYHRVYLYYSAQSNWNSVKTMAGQGSAAFDLVNQTGSIFEPKVAEGIFNGLIAENNVDVFTGLLDLSSGVVMSGKRITALKMEDGRLFYGKMFIDAGYEGDVVAGAGVSVTVGREANAVYDETINGVQSSAGNQVIDGLDPYVVKGNAASGLLPGIETGIAPNGTGDERLQAFCYRMCLTNGAGKVTVAKPADYDEADFELVIRAVELGQTGFFKTDGMPNKKTDSNNSTGISTDYVGKNYGPGWNWATLNHQQRADLAKRHEYWQRGMIWTLQNHPRVLAKVPGGIASSWGLPADEFMDNGNWPYQLYVREARRMVSDYVMTQKDCTGSDKAPDSIGLAAYTMDSHNVQRYNKNGVVKNEGDVQATTPSPYPVSYRSIIPKTGQCENLLVPWCLSASHMAFGSIRMEPVFMTLGQSAATAAVIAINDGASVQQISYDKLAAKLRADGQVLNLGTDDVSVTGVVVDNLDSNAVRVGEWTPSKVTNGYYGGNYFTDGFTGQGAKSVRYTPAIPLSGWYDVSLRWSALDNRASNVPVKIYHRDGVFSGTVNQKLKGGLWNKLGTFYFNAGSAGSLLIETTAADGYVIADAAQWSMQGGPSGVVDVFAGLPEVTRGSAIPAEFVFSRKGVTTAALTVNYSVSGSATTGEVSPALTGSVTIAAGAREAKISVAALQGSVPLGTHTLRIDLTANAAYILGTSTNATVTLRDEAFDAWRFSNFTSSQLANASISGATADPDGDGKKNLMEFFTGGSGLVSDSPSTPRLFTQDGNLYLGIRRHQDAQNLKISVWESSNLIDWSLTPELIMATPLQRNGVFQDLSIPVRAGNPLAEGRRFFQLRIQR